MRKRKFIKEVSTYEGVKEGRLMKPWTTRNVHQGSYHGVGNRGPVARSEWERLGRWSQRSERRWTPVPPTPCGEVAALPIAEPSPAQRSLTRGEQWKAQWDQNWNHQDQYGINMSHQVLFFSDWINTSTLSTVNAYISHNELQLKWRQYYKYFLFKKKK